MKIPRTQKGFTLKGFILKGLTFKGFTLIELLVVIGIIALLASIAVPAFTGVQIRAAQTKAMSNAKQIGLACKQFAIDNNGLYPTYAWSASGTGSATATTSNDCFENLLPTYLTTISLFWVAKSGFCAVNQPTDPSQSSMQLGTALPTGAGNNEWAYIPGLYDTSNSTFPLIADGFNALAGHVYSSSQTATGGVWKGLQAIVIFVDDSAKVMKTNAALAVPGSPNGNDLFDDTQSGSGWLSTSNAAINPG
jgi:prepilin-type N-terminal cleavage/methylation domain-containing protein